MTKKKIIFLSVLLLSLVIFFFLKRPVISRDFVQVPVHFFPFIDRPTIKLQIEDKDYSVLIDLGSSHPIDLCKEAMQKIKNKKNLGYSQYVGFKGKSYITQAFQVPRIKLFNLTIDGLIGFEENLDFIQDARTWKSSGLWSRIKDWLSLLTIKGRVGWTFFKEGIAIFNFPKSRLIVAKDISSVIKEGYSLEQYAKTPFEIQKYGLVLSVETDLGPQKFLLDTGTTCSIMKSSLFPEKKIHQLKKLKIADHDFGEWKFLLFDYDNQIECEGILGVDFFKKHAICIDFPNQLIYIKVF